MHELFFWINAIVALIGATFVITAKNPVRAVLSLIVTFLATAVTWLTLDAEFLAMTLILVYVGAVMVLFLFVVMMLDINFTTQQAKFTKWLPIGILLAIGLFMSIYTIIKVPSIMSGHSNEVTTVNNTQMLGSLLFKKYLLQFEMAGMILLTAIIAAIALVFRGPQKRKTQKISDQVKVDPKNRITLMDEI